MVKNDNRFLALSECISALKKFTYVKENDNMLESLDNIKNRIDDNVFKIAVVGEFSSGKSTFINAIIGKDVLLHSIEETTAAITYIHNVSEDNNKKGCCTINYRDGRSLNIDDVSDLIKYTTVQGGEDVSAQIASVDVYVHFLNVNYPVSIIDTPGLNGIADRHREITIEEIQKVNACIYILPLKGISKSDIEFISLLKKYQKNFIFIQNFKDSLKIDEGETPESKTDTIVKILNEEFSDNSIEFNKPICLSALMALTAKDEGIERLYEDSDILSSENRKRLYSNSGFCEFENEITELINSGEYKNKIFWSTSASLEQMLIYIIDELQENDKEMKELLQCDSKSNQNEILQRKIENLKGNKERNKSKLDNFVDARKSENQRLCREFLNESFDNLKLDLNSTVEKKLKVYNDYIDFEKNNKTSVSKFFSDKGNRSIKHIQGSVNLQIDDMLQNMYAESIMQVRRYGNNVNSDMSKFHIENINDNDIKYKSIDFQSERDKINVKEKALNEKKAEKNQLQSNYYIQSKLEQEQKNLENENIRHNNESRKIDKRSSANGAKPQYKTWHETELQEKRIHRKFLFWNRNDKIVYEYEQVERNNYEEIAAWERENAIISADRNSENEKHNRKHTELMNKINGLKSLLEKNKNQEQRIQKEIQSLQNEIKSDEETYEFLEKKAHAELLATIKGQLKKLLNNQCDNVLSKMKDYLDKYFETNTKKIKELVDSEYEKNIEKNIADLKNIINANNDELDKKYNVNENQLKSLKRMLKIIKILDGATEKKVKESINELKAISNNIC